MKLMQPPLHWILRGFLTSWGKGLTSDLPLVLRLRIKVKERGNYVDYMVCFLIRRHMDPSSHWCKGHVPVCLITHWLPISDLVFINWLAVEIVGKCCPILTVNVVTQNCKQTSHQGPYLCLLVHNNLSVVWFLFWHTVFVLCYIFHLNFINLWIIFWLGYQGIHCSSCTRKRDSYT